MQVLVYFAVAKMGDTPQDGKTELNPEGLTAATGKHAQAVADLFAKGDLSCKVRYTAVCVCTLSLRQNLLKWRKSAAYQLVHLVGSSVQARCCPSSVKLTVT